MANRLPLQQAVDSNSVLRWVSLVARVILGGAIAWAGIGKIGNLSQSVVAVRAYELPVPNWFNEALGYGLPIVELVLGVLIIAGLFTKWTVMLGGIMMIVYIAGIASAWIRKLTIDCGCFTPGGILDDGAKTQYLQDILRDTGFLICGVWAFLFPKSPVSVDTWLAGSDDKDV